MYKIRAMKEGFRRAGISFSKEAKTYPEELFTEEQIQQLQDEPMIEIQHLPDLKDADSDEEDQSRKVLEAMTNDKLKKECDAMGIEYPANATKAALVDLILEKTAPVPEA